MSTMTTNRPTPAHAEATGGGSGLTGTGTMAALFLRLDRVQLPLWLAGIVGIVAFSAAAVQGLYDTPAARATYASTVATSPAAIVMSGPPQALDTVGGITLFEINLTAAVGVALMAIFLTVRHTRAEEEAGRTELLRAGVLGRHASLAAAVLVVGSFAVLVGALLAVCLIALGLPASGSLLFGASMAALGLVFVAVAAVAAQVSEHGRAALGISLAVLGLSWALRSFGDVRGNAANWFSPVGWVQAVRAYGQQRWWPLLLALALTVLLLVLAVQLARRRDLGAGLVATRPGAPRAARILSSVPGLALVQQRSSIFWWTVAIFLCAVGFGSFGNDISTMLEDKPELAEALGGAQGERLVDGYFGLIMLILALLAACFTVSSVHRLRAEETAGRAEWLLATQTPRTRYATGWLAVTAAGSVLMLLAAGVGVGLADLLVTGSGQRFGSLVGAALAYLPALAVLGGLATALHGWVPRLAMLTWVVMAGCFVVGWLGDLLDIPAWIRDLSPFNRTPRLPLETLDWSVLGLLALVAAALLVLGLLGLRRRDVGTT